MSYGYIEYVLANYLASSIGQSEEEALDGLRLAIGSNPDFAASLRAELEQALGDNSFSWKGALESADVVVVEDERTARQYIRRLLWDSLFCAERT